MSAFGDLFRLFPAKVAELCLDECFMERRPVFTIDYDCETVSYAEQVPRCEVCGRVAFFHWRDDRYRDGEPPWVVCDQDTCDDQHCVELHAWYSARGQVGSKRRAAFRQKFGAHWVFGRGSDEKAARLALVMLEFTIREKKDEANGRRAA